MKWNIVLAACLAVALAPAGCGSSSDDGGGGGGGNGGADASTAGGTIDAGGGGGGGAIDAAGGGGGSIDAGGGGGGTDEAGIVHCNTDTCDLTAGDVCCITISGQNCTPADQCGDGFSAPQYCDGPEDCEDGQACCAVFDFAGDIGSFCRDSCQTNQQGNEAELCHTTDDCSHQGETCNDCQFMGAPTSQRACASDAIDACQS